jgi:acyl-CoA dehydrogenase
MMIFDLDQDYKDLQEEARELTRSIEHLAVEADNMSDLHPGILAALQASNLSNLMVPAAFGGRYETIDPLAICVVREVLMATSSHLDSLFALQGIGSYAVTVGGTDEQRAEWLPKVAKAEVLPALALTEVDAGSDIKRVTTEVTDSGNGLVLNGNKSFISNAGAASFYVVLAKDGTVDGGFSMFLVSADADGVEISPSPELIAPHVLGEVDFKNVQLTEKDRLGVPGKGMDLTLATLSVFRVSVAGAAIGLAQAALEEAVRHTRTRHQFGRPLARLGPVAAMLADSWTEIEMARLLAYRAAAMAKDDPGSTLQHSTMAKLAATEMASKVVDRSVQCMGRFGLIADSKIERLYRQARPMRIYEGASEVIRLGIAAELVRIVK